MVMLIYPFMFVTKEYILVKLQLLVNEHVATLITFPPSMFVCDVNRVDGNISKVKILR